MIQNAIKLIPATLFAPVALLLTGAVCSAQDAKIFDVRQFGAVGDGATLDTRALQTAVDACSASAGGGTLLLAGGKFVTGTLYLKSNVTLRVEAGATLLGSPNIADYATDTDRTMYKGEPYMDRCLIFAKDARNIGIEGGGTIDGQGKSFPNRGDGRKNRPKMFRLLRCSHVCLRDITLQSPASWTTEIRYCDDVATDNITIASRNISNGDGLDFDGCTKVRVSNSKFNTGDDSICLQTSSTDKPCRDFVITKCSFSSRWAGIRIGLLSRGDFEDVSVGDCTFEDHNDSGLKIQMNEGGEMKNLVFNNLTMKNVARPVFLTFCQKNAWVDAPGNELPPMKRVSNIQFRNITADSNTGKQAAFVVTGMPGHPVEDVVFSDIKAVFHGGGTEEDARTVFVELTPENLHDATGRERWPEYGLLRGTVPARGLYVRHVKGITLRNLEFTTRMNDARPPVVLVDASEIQADESLKSVIQP